MAGLTIVDSSVISGWLASSDPHHPAAREAIGEARQSGEIKIPLIVFSECLVRAFRVSEDRALAVATSIKSIGSVVADTIEIGWQAAKLRALHNLKMPDALVVATGVVLKADRILTFDKAWARIPEVSVLIGSTVGR